MNATEHAIQRLADRLTPDDRQAAVARMQALSGTLGRGSAAVIIGRSSNTHRVQDGSNGRVIVAIWRGEWKTVMLRREAQPNTPQALGVERVVKL